MDLVTNYMGLALPASIIAGGSKITGSMRQIKVLTDAVQIASCLYKNGPQY